MESNQPAAAPPKSGEDKTVAIVAYLSLIGFIVALILHNQPGKKQCSALSTCVKDLASCCAPCA